MSRALMLAGPDAAPDLRLGSFLRLGPFLRLGSSLRLVVPCLALLTAAPVLAHPHVFIDTRIEVILNDRNEATALRIGWTYDELYSLLFFGDLGLDPDGDGQLTAEEETQLNGFDMKWIDGFQGNTYVLMDGRPIPMSGPRDWTASYSEGKLSSTHVRDLATPVPVAGMPLMIQAYDPEYYYAHKILPPALVTGGDGCVAQVFEPDLDAADKILLEALKEFAPDADIEAQFPAVGANYSDEVRVTCAGP